MLDPLATAVVYLVGIYFVGLAAVALTAPGLATRFLQAHASTAANHHLELLVRAAVGAAFLLHGPSMRFGNVFVAFGWVLLVTTAVLMVLPWRWHQRFAQRAVPQAVRYLRVIAVASLFLGAFVIMATASGAP
jgi:hypothetical protein